MKSRGLLGEKVAASAGPREGAVDVHAAGTPRRDAVGELESAHFEGLSEATALARQLALVCRMNQTVALALAEARGRESNRFLIALMAAENAARRGRGKARKGVREKARR